MPRPDQRPARPAARILEGDHGAGPPTPAMVEQRAREIAVIEGRAPEETTREDRRRAAAELRGETPALSADEAVPPVETSRDPGEAAADTGHRVREVRPDDEQTASEHTFDQGVREAEHERMLRSRDERAPEDPRP